jgi:hypothetical protein
LSARHSAVHSFAVFCEDELAGDDAGAEDEAGEGAAAAGGARWSQWKRGAYKPRAEGSAIFLKGAGNKNFTWHQGGTG